MLAATESEVKEGFFKSWLLCLPLLKLFFVGISWGLKICKEAMKQKKATTNKIKIYIDKSPGKGDIHLRALR